MYNWEKFDGRVVFVLIRDYEVDDLLGFFGDTRLPRHYLSSTKDVERVFCVPLDSGYTGTRTYNKEYFNPDGYGSNYQVKALTKDSFTLELTPECRAEGLYRGMGKEKMGEWLYLVTSTNSGTYVTMNREEAYLLYKKRAADIMYYECMIGLDRISQYDGEKYDCGATEPITVTLEKIRLDRVPGSTTEFFTNHHHLDRPQ
jgi:hypothetical protein